MARYAPTKHLLRIDVLCVKVLACGAENRATAGNPDDPRMDLHLWLSLHQAY